MAPLAFNQGPEPLPGSGSSQIGEQLQPEPEQGRPPAGLGLGSQAIPKDLDHVPTELSAKSPGVQRQETPVG